MKNLLMCSVFLLGSVAVSAQSSINDLLAAGIDDAERYTESYLAPLSEGAIYNISGGWMNTAKAKPLLGFEVSVIGTIAPFGNKEDKKTFVLNTADYDNLRFEDGSPSKTVASALGDIEGIRVVVEDENGLFSESFELPSGLASEDLNFIPSGFLQASVGLIKGTEIKARFLPKIKAEDAEIGLYGFGLMHDFTSHLPADKILPVAISGFIGYTRLNGTYDLEATTFIDGSNQRIDTRMNSWTFQAAVSTRLPVINFFGFLGYISGKSETDILGTYEVVSGPIQTTYTDPFSVTENVGGFTGTLGARLKLGFFRLHADYTLAAFNTVSFGMHFGFR